MRWHKIIVIAAVISIAASLDAIGGSPWFFSVWNPNRAISAIDKGENMGPFTSLFVDHKGASHISYHDYPRHHLKYATNDSGKWATEIVDSNGEVGEGTSISVDREGAVHIAYFDRRNGALKYAHRPAG